MKHHSDKSKLKAISAAILFFVISLPSLADSIRHIHLNGEHLTDENILLLDQFAGNLVGDGDYWLNMQTGEWGYEGNDQVQGILANITNQTSYYNQPQYQQDNNDYNNEANQYNDWEGVSGTGSVTSGQLNGQNCTFVSVGGTTMKSCD